MSGSFSLFSFLACWRRPAEGLTAHLPHFAFLLNADLKLSHRKRRAKPAQKEAHRNSLKSELHWVNSSGTSSPTRSVQRARCSSIHPVLTVQKLHKHCFTAAEKSQMRSCAPAKEHFAAASLGERRKCSVGGKGHC